TGRVSSRKIEQATYEDVACRVLACNQHPDHDSIAEFRKQHLQELAKLLAQVLQMGEQAGLGELGDVANDGSKLRANASKAKAQRNFTDPESRIMKDSATGSFEQSYNAQIAVDSESQIIVACSLTQEVNDKQQLVPMLTAVKENLGQWPEKATADAGYFSAAAVSNAALSSVDLYVT